MTEKRFGRKAIAYAVAERADIVDGFAVEDGFAEEVLLGVGDGLAIGVGSGGVGEDAREVGGCRAGQRDADARLDDGEAAGANARDGIEDHAIERVGDGFNHAAGGVGRELGVGVERDDVGDGARQFAYAQDGGITFTAEECVEIFELAALAFAADPAALAFGPHAGAVKQKKAVAGIAGVELFDALASGGENFGVAEGVDILGIGEVREQAVENVGFLIR